MKIKWKSVYWPLGEWQNEAGDKVEITGNFKAKYEGKDIIVNMVSQTSQAGHGDPAITASIPSFLDIDTGNTLSPEGFIETAWA